MWNPLRNPTSGPARHLTRSTALALLLAVSLAITAAALAQGATQDPLPATEPEQVGLSAQRLAHIEALFEAGIEAGEIPGAVALIARDGQIAYFEAFGERNAAQGSEMTTDTIFRMASMTKPVVTVGAMILHERGEFALMEPVSRYLPELADMEVGVEITNPRTGEPTYYTVPAAREITIEDLMRHTSGITYGYGGGVDALYRELGVGSDDEDLETLVEKLGQIPLAHQPGEVWEYGYSTDVLGRLIEVVSGLPLDEFLSQEVFEPLGMNDTGFHVPEESHERIAEGVIDDETDEPVEMGDVRTRPTLISGGGGMVSTAGDYARFLQMLLNGGELDGTRILGSETVEYMVVDHLAPLDELPLPRESAIEGFVGRTANESDLPGVGFGGYGLGFGVRTEEVAGMPGSLGEYYWSGGSGTFFWVDPSNDMFALYLSQDPSGAKTRVRMIYKAIVHGAIVE